MMNCNHMIYHYAVAGLPFAVSLPVDLRPDILLPSFRDFRIGAGSGCGGESPCGTPVFTLRTADLRDRDTSGDTLLESSSDEMGKTELYAAADGYLVLLRPSPGAPSYMMCASRDFTSACIGLGPVRAGMDSGYTGPALTSMLRILYSQSVLMHGAVSIHASAVVLEGRSYLFTGRSGAGKSTHSRLWLGTFPGAALLNDDNPVIRIVNGQVMAYGTPWSGKTPCYRNTGMPVGGIVRIVQARENIFTPLCDVDAFTSLLPGCSLIRHDPVLLDALCGTLVEVSTSVPVGILGCKADSSAAVCCREALSSY